MHNVQISRSSKHLGKSILPPGWHWDNIRLSDFDLWVALGGEGEFYTEKQTFAIRRGCCFILRPGVEYSFADACHLGGKKLSSGLDHIYIHFNFLDKRGRIIKTPAVEDLPEACYLQNLPFVEDLLTRVIREYKSPGEARKRDADAWLSAALHEIERQNRNASQERGTALLHAQIVEKVCTIIDEHPEKDFRIEAFARTNGYSHEHFCRIFRKLKGVSPVQYIVQARIDSAMSLLRTSSMTISEIALASGYNDIYFFSRQFRKKNGISPSQFRKLSP